MSESETFADLHYKLGRAVEQAPGKVARIDGGKPIDSTKRHFNGLEIDATIRPTPALDNFLAEARARDPWFDERCQAEWDAVDVNALIIEQQRKRRREKRS